MRLLTTLVLKRPGRGSCTIGSAVFGTAPWAMPTSRGARLEAHVVIADDELDDRPDLVLHLRAEIRDQADCAKVAGCGLVGELMRRTLDAGDPLALAILGHGHL